MYVWMYVCYIVCMYVVSFTEWHCTEVLLYHDTIIANL